MTRKRRRIRRSKAIQYIRAGISRVLYQSELFERQLEITPDVLVIGGGIAGLEAALSLAGEDRKVYLAEKTAELGGKSAGFTSLLPRQGRGAEAVKQKIEAVRAGQVPNVAPVVASVEEKGAQGGDEP